MQRVLNSLLAASLVVLLASQSAAKPQAPAHLTQAQQQVRTHMDSQHSTVYVCMAHGGDACLTMLLAMACPMQPPGNGFLVPIVRGFANNQILGLKEVLALGQVLGEYCSTVAHAAHSTHQHQ